MQLALLYDRVDFPFPYQVTVDSITRSDLLALPPLSLFSPYTPLLTSRGRKWSLRRMSLATNLTNTAQFEITLDQVNQYKAGSLV